MCKMYCVQCIVISVLCKLYKVLASVLALVSARAEDPLEGLRQTVPGEPGTDYPILAAIPQHSFSCEVTL